MVSGFKYYSKRGMRTLMSTDELVEVNHAHVGCSYASGVLPDELERSMEPLLESPGLCIIDPTKAGDGYWNYKKMATQTEYLMHALQELETEIQQLHQFDWSSGHKKGKEGALNISNTSFNFGGKGGKRMRESELSEDLVGDEHFMAMMYESINAGSPLVWYLTKTSAEE